MGKPRIKIPITPSSVPAYKNNQKKVKKGGCGCGGKKTR